MSAQRRDFAGILGLGVAACALCCAGPTLAVLGGISLAGLASTFVFGAAGLAISATTILAIVVVGRTRTTRCSGPADGPVPVAAPTRTNSNGAPS